MADTTFVDGETLIEAAWLNDVNDVVYNPSAAIIPASSIVNTPAGNIEATDVQTAINELDSEKQPLDAELSALATSTAAANKIPYFTGTTTASTLDWNSATTLANSATTVSSNTVVKAAIDAMDIDTQVAPETSGNVLTSNGSAWASAAPTCVAWVNFNGTGTPTIRASSANVASITDNGTGDYTVNFSPALADANYASCISAGESTNSLAIMIGGTTGTAPTSSALRFKTVNSASGAAIDVTYISVAIFR